MTTTSQEQKAKHPQIAAQDQALVERGTKFALKLMI
jgi:hypothetical protein